MCYAENCGLPFYTPESLFTCATLLPATPYPHVTPAFDPATLRNRLQEDIGALVRPKDSLPELVLLVGPPASGKSSLCETYYRDYERVSQDVLKTLRKCQLKAIGALKMKKSVVVDNTNGSVSVLH